MQNRVKKDKPPTPEDLAKLAMADKLGLRAKIEVLGWGALIAAETGRIGGHIGATRRKNNRLESQ